MFETSLRSLKANVCPQEVVEVETKEISKNGYLARNIAKFIKDT